MVDVSVVPEVRGSERQLFKRCPWAWQQAYRFGLKPRRVKDALWFGELVHISLAGWYQPGSQRGPHPAETFNLLYSDEETRFFKTEDATEEERAKYTDLRVLGTAMLEGYVGFYGNDDSWEVLSPEKTFSFNVPFLEHWSDETREFLARYVGTYDLAYRDLISGWIYLGEHKTAKSIRTDHLQLDDQAGPYFATARNTLMKAGLMSPKEHFKGIMYNFLRKGLPDPRPVDEKGYACNKPTKADYVAALTGVDRWTAEELTKKKVDDLEGIAAGNMIQVLGERSKVQPAKLYLRHPVNRTRAEQRSQLVRLQNDLTIMEMARRGEIPITKTTHWSCARFCDFHEICTLHETSGNWKELRSVAYRVEDPYAAHRKSTDEIATFEY